MEKENTMRKGLGTECKKEGWEKREREMKVGVEMEEARTKTLVSFCSPSCFPSCPLVALGCLHC